MDFFTTPSTYYLKVPFPLIKWARDTDNIRLLAAWLIIKRQFRTGHIHQIANLKYFHRNTASKYIHKLLEIGLIEKEPSFGYRCISLKRAVKLLTSHKGRFAALSINRGEIGFVVKQLRSLLIYDNLKKQRRQEIEKKYKATDKWVNDRARRKYSKLGSVNLTLSDRGVGRIIGRSANTGAKLKDWLSKAKLVKFKNQDFKYAGEMIGDKWPTELLQHLTLVRKGRRAYIPQPQKATPAYPFKIALFGMHP